MTHKAEKSFFLPPLFLSYLRVKKPYLKKKTSAAMCRGGLSAVIALLMSKCSEASGSGREKLKK